MLAAWEQSDYYPECSLGKLCGLLIAANGSARTWALGLAHKSMNDSFFYIERSSPWWAEADDRLAEEMLVVTLGHSIFGILVLRKLGKDKYCWKVIKEHGQNNGCPVLYQAFAGPYRHVPSTGWVLLSAGLELWFTGWLNQCLNVFLLDFLYLPMFVYDPQCRLMY